MADKTPPRLLLPFFRQFGKPQGLLGRLALKAMEKGNRAVNAWVLDVLEVGPGDRVLDVGCGPGVGVSMAKERGADVAGIDVSEAAVARARRRNPKARIEVGSADAPPFADHEFTAVFSVNSMGFWPDPEAALRAIRRVVTPGGRVAIALRMKVEGVKRTERRAYGSTPDQISKVENLMRHVGFEDVETQTGAPGGEATSVAVGKRR